MIKVLVVVTLLATALWAEDSKKGFPPYEHRGFFFSAGLGLGYSQFSTYREATHGAYTYDEYIGDGYVNWQSYSFVDHSIDEEYSGFAAPMMEFRFGRSFGNLIAVYSLFEAGMSTGSAKVVEKRYTRPIVEGYNGHVIKYADEDVQIGETTYKEDVYAVSGMAGLGFAVYPFRDPNNMWNGTFFAYTGGIAGICTVDGNDIDTFGQINVLTRFEIGKDWWVSETWSIGASFVYSLFSVIEDDMYENYRGDRTEIRFLIRITRG